MGQSQCEIVRWGDQLRGSLGAVLEEDLGRLPGVQPHHVPEEDGDHGVFGEVAEEGGEDVLQAAPVVAGEMGGLRGLLFAGAGGGMTSPLSLLIARNTLCLIMI